MTQAIQSIKKVGLFLLGVVTILFGFKANVVNTQTKPEASEATTPEVAKKAPANVAPDKAPEDTEATQHKPKTKVEKAKPERAHASKVRWNKGKKWKPADNVSNVEANSSAKPNTTLEK